MNDSDKEKIKELFKKAKNILVFTGAGVSTNSGIPDYRSEDGLYNRIRKNYKEIGNPEDMFDISYFKENPTLFYQVYKNMINLDVKPSITHNFIAYLEKIGKINLVVTQNIDMLHQKAGTKKLLECHGSYEHAHCMKCSKYYPFEGELEQHLKDGAVYKCSCGGVVKPDIVFFGENLPKSFYKIYHFPPKIDLLLVMGTSLSVMPSSGFALGLASKVPSIIVNLTKTSYDKHFTYSFLEDVDNFSKDLWEEMERESLNKID